MRVAALVLFAFSSIAQAQYTGMYRDGVDVSRGPMPGERALDARVQADPPSTPPPLGPVHCMAEYEPMQGIIVAWEGTTAQNSILAQMAKEFTSADGDADVYVVVDTTSEQTTANATLVNAGVNMARVKYVVRTTDTIWCRDYGPRYILQGGCRAIVKHTYNRNRPSDNALSFGFSELFGQQLYEIPLVHGGGNYHLDALNRSWATRLIANENPTKSEAQIVQLWRDYQNLNTTLTDPFPTSIDSTQHIDMWMQIIGDSKVVISDWPQNAGSVQDNICDSTAASMQLLGYEVVRMPAFTSGGTHYTYTNVVMCNGVVIVPSFTTGSYNAQALATWQAALPGKRVVQLNCQALVTSAGVVHCVVMHVPRYTNGAVPTGYCASPNGGETLTPGQSVKVKWAADDDIKATSVDLLLSLDGGVNYDRVLANARPAVGDFDWTVPDVYSTNAKIRVVVHDADGNSSYDESDAEFSILGAQVPPVADLTVSRGSVLGGTIDSLRNQEQSYLLVERQLQTVPDPFNRPQIELVCGFQSTVATPARLELTVVSKSVAATTATLALKNWSTGRWDDVDSYTLSSTDVVRALTGLSVTDHVRNDGRVEVRIGNRQDAPYFTTYKSSFDFVQLKVRS